MPKDKITTSYRVKPAIARELRLMAVKNDKNVGDVLEAFVKFHRYTRSLDTETRLRFDSMFETALVNSGIKPGKTGWTGKPGTGSTTTEEGVE